MSKQVKFCLVFAILSMSLYLILQTMIVAGVLDTSYTYDLIGYICVLLFFPLSGFSLISLHGKINRKGQMIDDKLKAIDRANIVVIFDSLGKVISANDNFRHLLKVDKYKGLHHSVFLLEDSSEKLNNDIFWTKLRSGEFISGTFRRKDFEGNEIWIQASYSPIKSRNGQVYQVIKIANDVTDDIKNRQELTRKNIYLEHAAKILRHDMHSGINTYIPRGIKSLRRRLNKEDIEKLKLASPLRLIEEGLSHAQMVYKGIYEFTNLVKRDSVLTKQEVSLKSILGDYLSKTSYSDQVALDRFLPKIEVNPSLFCTAIDNLIRNGIKYNDSEFKMVAITMIDDWHLAVIDNGRGLSQEEFEELCSPYTRKKDQAEAGSGLGLNITKAILNEHGFQVSVEKLKLGTRIKIKVR